MSANTISRKPGQRRITTVFLLIFFILLCTVILLPFISIVLTSFKDSSMVIRNGFNLQFNPQDLTLDNFIYVFTGDHQYFRWFGNSLFLTLIQTVITLFVSAWVSYGFAFYEFKGKIFVCLCVDCNDDSFRNFNAAALSGNNCIKINQ